MSTTQEESKATPSARPGRKWESHTILTRQRLAVTTVAIITMLFAAVAAFVWREHEIALDKSGERAERLAEGLARDLEQTLTVARAVINQVDDEIQTSTGKPATPTLERAHASGLSNLLASLPLPFELNAIGEQGRPISIVGQFGLPAPDAPNPGINSNRELETERWTLRHKDEATRERLVPLAWKSSVGYQSVDGYEVDLSLLALNTWLEQARIETDDRASLFWMNTDGTASLLARAPAVPAELGQRVRARWVDQANQSDLGTVDQQSALDGMARRTVFRRLSGPARDLAIVYGVGTDAALAQWRHDLPYFIAVALFLAAAMAHGAWRLDRTLQALRRSERSFQLILDSGQVWDWNIATNTMRYAPTYLKRLGVDPAEQDLARAFFDNIVPEDLGKVKAALKAHLKHREPYHLKFRLRDAEGNVHWMVTRGLAFWDKNGRALYMAGTTMDISDRVALEEERHRTLQQLDAVANASSVLFWTTNVDGEASWFNRRWLAFTGRTLEQELGHGWLQAVHPDDQERKLAFLALMRSGQASVSAEVRLRNQEGTYRWMMVQCLALKGEHQETTGYIGSCVDVSDLKRAESAARQQGAMLETVFNVLQDLLFVVDEEGLILHYQGIAEEQLYAPQSIFLGKQFREVLPGDVAELFQRRLAMAKTGQLQEFDYRLPLPDGVHHFDARMARLPGSEHYMIVARDITERDKLQQRSEELQQFMALQARLATNFINLSIPSLGEGINRALAEIGQLARADRAYIFEFDMAARTASNTHEWCAPGIRSAMAELQNLPFDLFQHWVDAFLAHQMVSIPDVAATPPGPLRETLVSQDIQSLITLPLTSGGSCLGFVGFDSVRARHEYSEEQIDLLKLFAQMLVNVYSRKAAHDQLQRLASELEQRVQERTAQLDVSVRRLKQANQELDSFAYSVSHDLKSPLRSVEGFASLLLEEHSASLNDEGRDYLRRIQSASRHMARLINDLLAYCRMEDMDGLIVPVCLAQVVDDVLGGMRNELETRQAKVNRAVPAPLHALANPQGLAMVLRNLTDNAIKFARPGNPPAITITARAEGAIVRLCLADEGQGFDMQYHDRIFALFQRLHRPEAVAGTGIGLAMVHKAIQRMNGRIWAESTPGQGAKFHIELPRA